MLSPPDGAPVALFRNGEGVAVLRVSLAFQEGPAEAGVARVLRDLALERMRSLARPVAARVRAEPTPRGFAFQVEGSEPDFEYLAYILRRGLADPGPGDVSLAAARRELNRELDRELETPRGRLARSIREALPPGFAPPEVTQGTLASLDAGRVREAWARLRATGDARLVVSVPAAPEVVLAAAAGLPRRGAGPLPLDAPPPPSAAPEEPQTLRWWYAVAWPVDRRWAAAADVAIRLAGSLLKETAERFPLYLEVWDLPGGLVFVVSGAAYRRDRRAMEGAVDEFVAHLRSRISAGEVARAAAAAQRDLLLAARSPQGLVASFGRAADDGDSWTPDALWEAAYALGSVSAADVGALLDHLLARSPLHARVNP